MQIILDSGLDEHVPRLCDAREGAVQE